MADPATQPRPPGIVLLAAGGSTRFGSEKLLTLVEGKRLIDWATSAAVESGLEPIWIVTRPDLPLSLIHPAITIVKNTSWKEGLASSIRSAIDAAREAAIDGLLFAPADQPFLTSAIYRRLAGQFQKTYPRTLAASYGGQIRNPVLLARPNWPLAAPLQGDTGLSTLIRNPQTLAVDCSDIGSLFDIDTPEDLEKIRKCRHPTRLHA